MRSSVRTNGQSEPHTQRSSVNASIAAAINGSTSGYGQPSRDERNGPESLTTALPERPSSSSVRKPGLVEAARHVRPAEVVDHDPDSRPADDGRRKGQLVLLAVDLEEPAHLLQPGEQPRGGGVVELRHAEGAEIEAHPDHAAVGERSQLTVGDVGLHQGDALETSRSGGKAVEQAAIVGAVRLGADQEPMRQAVRVEHGQEPRHAARLARMRLVGRIRRIRKAGAAEHVGVAVGSAQRLHASPPQERSVRRLSRNPDRRSRISGAPMPRIAFSVAASMPCW